MITDIRLQHFRSYTDASFELDNGVNIIVGPNASGKTNLLEAIMVVGLGSSYRAKEQDLVQFGAGWARIDADTPTAPRTVKITTTPPGKQFDIDGQRVSRLHHSRTLPLVLFEPDHLRLLSGSPEGRRAFLDDLLAQSVPGFTSLRLQYKRVLAQRNALLKKNPPQLRDQLFVWDIRLSELGGQIAALRMRLISRFNEHIADLYSTIAGRTSHVALAYATKCDTNQYESQLLQKLHENVALDVVRGFTAYGPHRDDISVTLHTKPVQDTASRGEIRTMVLALKVLELRLLEDIRDQRPLLLLDDVFSELDGSRRQALTRYVQPYQTFITTTDADVVLQHFTGSAIIPTTQ